MVKLRRPTVADDYPAVTDSNGVTWYRPVRGPGVDIAAWGWTAQRSQAHPSYEVAEEE